MSARPTPKPRQVSWVMTGFTNAVPSSASAMRRNPTTSSSSFTATRTPSMEGMASMPSRLA